MMAQPRPVQRFTDAYLERCRDLSPDDMVRFLEDFKRIQSAANGVPVRERGARTNESLSIMKRL